MFYSFATKSWIMQIMGAEMEQWDDVKGLKQQAAQSQADIIIIITILTVNQSNSLTAHGIKLCLKCSVLQATNGRLRALRRL